MSARPLGRFRVIPDASRPCVSCRWCQRPGRLARALLLAEERCLALPVRGLTISPVTGESRKEPPAPCHEARSVHGECGPSGRYWEAPPDDR